MCQGTDQSVKDCESKTMGSERTSAWQSGGAKERKETTAKQSHWEEKAPSGLAGLGKMQEVRSRNGAGQGLVQDERKEKPDFDRRGRTQCAESTQVNGFSECHSEN